MSTSRYPFPEPRYETTCSLSGIRREQKNAYDNPTHIAQTEEPWRRLYGMATLASTLRTVMCNELQAPKDSLDFQLNSVYDHHKNFFWTKNQMLYQSKTVAELQTKREKQDMLEEGRNSRQWVDGRRYSA